MMNVVPNQNTMHLRDRRDNAVISLLDRWATPGMRRRALLLGFAAPHAGVSTADWLHYLSECGLGFEIGLAQRDGDERGRAWAEEMLVLARALHAPPRG